ncbi:MAG: hypothetical protein FJ090_04500 [Deltaproteobacteria bacterium]|nr:hypothetical protein [Deltaproteobacteria bacterium]
MSAPILAVALEPEPAQAPAARAEPGFDGLLAMAVSDFFSLGTEPHAKPVRRGKKGEAAGAGEGTSAQLVGVDPSSGPLIASPPGHGGGDTGVVVDAALGFYAREAPDVPLPEESDPAQSSGVGEDHGDQGQPYQRRDDEPREMGDHDALAAHLDHMGIDVEVSGLAVPREPFRFSDAPAAGLGAPVEMEAPEIVDTAAAMDLRALEVRDGVTVRVNDSGRAWEIDVVRHDNTLDLAVRADAQVREIIAAEQDSIRAAVAREGYQLGSLDIAERRSVETAQAVKATEASQSLDNTSSHMSHQDSNPQARREELPPWPAPRFGRRAATAEPTRQGRLDRDA